VELLSVHLRNVRSFEEVTIPFASGVVRIAGENGAGKSTILAAVAYAVLGRESIAVRRYALDGLSAGSAEPPGSKAKRALDVDHVSKLLRRGADWGLVEVVFRLARHPGKRFRIHRVLGERPRSRRPRGSAPADPLETEDAALVELGGSLPLRLDAGRAGRPGGADPVTAALADLLDLSPDAFAHAFHRIVAAPQGRLLQAVTEENRTRRELYWKILGVDRYASAGADASSLGAALVARYLEPLERAVARAARAVEELEDAPRRVEDGVVEVAQATDRRAAAAARRAAAHEARERAQESQARARERQVEAERIAHELARLEAQELEAEAAVRAAEAAAERRERLAPARELYERLRAGGPPLEARRTEHARLTAALEDARKRDAALGGRDSAELARVGARLREAQAKFSAHEARLVEIRRERGRLERARGELDDRVRTAVLRSGSLARWCERALPALGRLTSVARELESAALLERLAATAPPAADDAGDLALLGRAREIEDRVARANEDLGALRALVDNWAELEGRAGEDGTCPFLREPCPHERGRDLARVVREGAAAARGRLEVAASELRRASAEQAALRESRERVEKMRSTREAWRDRVARAALECAAAVRRFDEERAALEASIDAHDLFFEPPPEARATLGVLARACAAISPVRETGKTNDLTPDSWDRDAVGALARAASQRLAALRALPSSLSAELSKARGLAERDAATADRRRSDANRDLDRVATLLERAPGESAELARARDALSGEHDALASRHAADAAARAEEAAAFERALAALGPVLAEFLAWKAELESARRDHDEHNRLEGVAASLGTARERLESLRAASRELAARGVALARAEEDSRAEHDPVLPSESPHESPRLATAREESPRLGTAREESPRLATARLVRSLADATGAARRRLEEARRDEEAAERELVSAESFLEIRKDRLVEAMRRRDALLERQGELRRKQSARDHVAHACSVLRGSSGEGPLATALFKVMGELPNRLAERRVRQVALHARRIYRALAPHETWDLAWDPKSYVLALAPPGTEPSQAVRTGIAVDDMSGGQQMSAALALHLALVHTYARNCDLLFLDEPTTNLDAKRRAALAECLRSLRSRAAVPGETLVPLKQIVLVSHDEAFEALEDQTIQVARDESGGPSRVELARSYTAGSQIAPAAT
jgi:DNA repair exonuclease SbcCD ATPase subunit